jgi:hypothetical protein
MPDDTVCAFCGKTVLLAALGSRVREGEKVFHLDCYVLYKRQPPKP